MPNAVVMTRYGPPEVLKWARVPLAEPGEGQIRIKVNAAGISPTDLALRAGYLKAIPLPPDAVLGFEAAGTVDAVGPGVTGTSIGDGVTALLLSLGGYAEYAVASIWAGKPDGVTWIDAAALPGSAEAAIGVLRQLGVQRGETLLLFGGGGSVGIIATQLAVAQGVTVISAVGEHDETLARELGATPVRYGAGVAGRVRALGAVDAVFDAAGQGVLADALTSASRCRSPRPTVLPVPWMRRSPCWPTAGSACARTNPCPCRRPPRPTASWKAATSTSALSSPSSSAGGAAAARPAACDMPPGPRGGPASDTRCGRSAGRAEPG
jgi:D-arabinose 1-dehydrogenase-like Zn-dependent alcohol dehydrogenase